MPYLLYSDDNQIEFLHDRDDVKRCAVCGVPTHPFDHGFPNKKKSRKDLSNCFEGFELASKDLKEFLQQHCTTEVDYFETGGGQFILRPVKTVFVDLTVALDPKLNWAIPTLADDFCQTCGRSNSCHGKIKGILDGQSAIENFGLLRTAQEFGAKMHKNFGLVAGNGLVELMKAKSFKGPVYVPL